MSIVRVVLSGLTAGRLIPPRFLLLFKKNSSRSTVGPKGPRKVRGLDTICYLPPGRHSDALTGDLPSVRPNPRVSCQPSERLNSTTYFRSVFETLRRTVTACSGRGSNFAERRSAAPGSGTPPPATRVYLEPHYGTRSCNVLSRL